MEHAINYWPFMSFFFFFFTKSVALVFHMFKVAWSSKTEGGFCNIRGDCHLPTPELPLGV